jgi:hypothetical protein
MHHLGETRRLPIAIAAIACLLPAAVAFGLFYFAMLAVHAVAG